ncbi:MAG: phosphohistidine phosphatase SixA [Dissulfurispiraceae bacterium]
MFLYLVRHGEAKGELEDPARPLSEEGYQDVKKIGSYAARLNIKVDGIFCSNKLRAKQTAEVLSSAMGLSTSISQKEGLAPLDDPKILAERLKDSANDIMIVGHLPHLQKLASLLLCGSEDKALISFRAPEMVCLEMDKSGTWSILWLLSPEVVL